MRSWPLKGCPAVIAGAKPCLDPRGGATDIRVVHLPWDVTFVLTDHRDPRPEERVNVLRRGATIASPSLHDEHRISLVHDEPDRGDL